MAKRSLCIIPQPKQVTWGQDRFLVDAQTWILLLPDAGDQEHFAARSLQKEILQATGLLLPIIKTAHPARTENIVLLVSDRQAAQTYLGDLVTWVEALNTHGGQAHFVDVTPERVVAGGQGAAALHYAVQTLRQIARTEHNLWPALHILDWPSFPYRGLMLDVSRGKVPTLETLKLLVDQLSLYKANVLQLYTEHTFVFPHHPRIGEDCGSLSGDDILELDDYARRHHVELMPNLNSFGHCAHILNLPEYQHLAESAARWSLCPTDEATYTFLADLYADLLPAFTSKTFNVGCDETWDLGKGRSADAVAQSGTGRVYLQHILRLHELAQAHGRRIQIWGDILLHYPELVSELPEDVTLLDWHYGASDDYPSVRTIAQSGRDFWVCPGTSSWNTLFPRIENANGNIRTLARLGAEHGASGLLNTDWGDHGHYQPIGQCWYGYVYGAEQAWTGGATEDGDFDTRFATLFFGVSGVQVVATMRELASLDTLPGMSRRNASGSIYALLDEPLVGVMIDTIPSMTLEEIIRVSIDAERTLRGAIFDSRDPLSLEEMITSARMMAYAARKTLASQRTRADLATLSQGEGAPSQGEGAPSQGKGAPVAVVRQAIETFRALDAELVQLTRVFRQDWLRRARHAEMSITLGHFSRLRERFAAAQSWLQERLAQIETDEAPSYDLSHYAEEASQYQILGQAFWRHMREAGVSLD